MSPPASVLIVDSDQRVCRALASALRIDGFDVLCVGSAPEALGLLARIRCDLALIDLMLPGINGLQLARQLAQLFPRVRVVLTSSYHLSERQLRDAACGAVGFVPKPCPALDVAAFLRDKASA